MKPLARIIAAPPPRCNIPGKLIPCCLLHLPSRYWQLPVAPYVVVVAVALSDHFQVVLRTKLKYGGIVFMKERKVWMGGENMLRGSISARRFEHRKRIWW
jgi:hypothetical protein